MGLDFGVVLDVTHNFPAMGFERLMHLLCSVEVEVSHGDVAGGGIFDACLRTLKFCGRIVVLGFTTGRIAEVKTNYLLLKNITVHGSSINSFYAQDLAAVRHGQTEMFRLHSEGKLAPHVHSRFPLEQVAQAIADVESRSVIGKVLLEV